jgi:hypothetical protein
LRSSGHTVQPLPRATTRQDSAPGRAEEPVQLGLADAAPCSNVVSLRHEPFNAELNAVRQRIA